MVPHAGTAPVQLSWAPDPASVGAVQLVFQVLDASGQLLASAPLPTITVPSAPSAVIAQPTSTASQQNNVAVPPAISASTPAPQISISYFGPSGSAPASAGQIPEFSVQVSNPSTLPSQAGQAQFLVDGTAQQTQPFDAMLPNGSHSIVFPASQAAGPHALQVLVTTGDGANASATANATVAAAPPTDTSISGGSTVTGATGAAPMQSTFSGGATSTNTNKKRVRAGLPSTFRIGNTTWANGVTAPAATANAPATQTTATAQNTAHHRFK